MFFPSPKKIFPKIVFHLNATKIHAAIWVIPLTIQDLIIFRSDLTRKLKPLVQLLIGILEQTPYFCHAFQLCFFQPLKKYFSRQFFIWMQQKISCCYLGHPTYSLLGQLASYEQHFDLKIYALQAICFIYIAKFAFFV